VRQDGSHRPGAAELHSTGGVYRWNGLTAPCLRAAAHAILRVEKKKKWSCATRSRQSSRSERIVQQSITCMDAAGNSEGSGGYEAARERCASRWHVSLLPSAPFAERPGKPQYLASMNSHGAAARGTTGGPRQGSSPPFSPEGCSFGTVFANTEQITCDDPLAIGRGRWRGESGSQSLRRSSEYFTRLRAAIDRETAC